MARKSSVSSRPAERKSMRSKDMRKRQWTKEERQVLRRAARRQAADNESDINFEDIPRLTNEQLAKMVRLRDIRPKVAVSVRLDSRVLDWLKSKGEGHLTRINDILTNLMEAEISAVAERRIAEQEIRRVAERDTTQRHTKRQTTERRKVS